VFDGSAEPSRLQFIWCLRRSVEESCRAISERMDGCGLLWRRIITINPVLFNRDQLAKN